MNTHKNVILENCCIVEGTHTDYEILAKYHYQPVLKVPLTKIYKLIGTGRFRDIYPDPLSVIVFMQPFPEISARTKATAGYFHQYESHADNLRLLNKCMLYLTRLITDTRVVRKGLATKLIRESLELLDIPLVEILTPIDFTNHMYQKCGFELHYTPAPMKYRRLINAFRIVGVNITETMAPELIDMRLSNLPPAMSLYIEKEIAKFLGGFRNAARFTPGPERTKFLLSKVPPPEAYLIWFNPQAPKAQEVRQFITEHPDMGGGQPNLTDQDEIIEPEPS